MPTGTSGRAALLISGGMDSPVAGYMMAKSGMEIVGIHFAALITGESVAQVASQTLPALVCTDAAVNMPVFRPVIGMDKNEIIIISRQIDTFDISIQPFEDCCTVFTPKHPRTRPKLGEGEAAEAVLDIEALTDRAVEGAVLKLIEAE